MKKVSLIFAIRDDNERVEIILEQLISQDYPQEQMEILILDEQLDEEIGKTIINYQSKHPNIKSISSSQKEKVSAYNIGIRKSLFDIICLIDLKADYPKDYVSKMLHFIDTENAEACSGRWKIKSASKSLISESISAALNSSFVVGNAQFRMNSKKTIETNLLPSACYRKDAFEKYGYFDEELLEGFEFEFCGRIIQRGGRAIFNPEMDLDYIAPENMNDCMQFFYQSAYYKPFINEKLKASATFRQLAPSLALLFFVFAAITSFISPLMLLLFIFAGMVYLFGDIWESFGIGIEKDKARLTTVLLFIFPLIHMSFGLGYLHGLWNRRIKNKKKELIGDQRIQ